MGTTYQSEHHTLTARQYLIENIIDFVSRNKPDPIDGWDDIDFENIESLRSGSDHLFEHELIVLMVELEYMSSKNVPRNEIMDQWNERIKGLPDGTGGNASPAKRLQPRKLQEQQWEREKRIEQIIDFVHRTGIDRVEGWEDVDFEHIETLRWNKELLLEELDGLWDELNRIHSEQSNDDRTDMLDALAIVEKYKNGDVGVGTGGIKPFVIDDRWRSTIPAALKKAIPDWNTVPIDRFYEQAKQAMGALKGKDLSQVRIFISDLSEILYDKEQYEAELAKAYEPPEEISEDAVSDHVMRMLEIIMLPRIEAIDKYERSGGRIIFSNLWDLPFKESLKQEVKERDGWKCVVCESESDLHVHHKIPRNLGGIHHKHNLVTLCASCHGVIETGDMKKAFSKCLMNYRRNKAMKSFNKQLSVNKSVLKEEIIEKLDYLLHALTNKNEALASEVVEIMARFELLHAD